MKDTELRELCTRFFDAVEQHDVEAVADIYAPGFRFWTNVTGQESSREANLQTLREGYALHRRRTYDDRIIDTFETGFLVRYSVNIVEHNGRQTSLWACIVAQCKDGRIAHIDEYLDSGKFRRAERRTS
jgi:SnoaL-like domain